MAAVLAGGGQEYVPFAGQSVGLIHEVRPAAEIVHRTVTEASRILAGLGRASSLGPSAAVG